MYMGDRQRQVTGKQLPLRKHQGHFKKAIKVISTPQKQKCQPIQLGLACWRTTFISRWARNTSLQVTKGDPCVQNALGAAHCETQCWLQGGPGETELSPVQIPSPLPAVGGSAWALEENIRAVSDSRCDFQQGQPPPLVTGKVHLALPTALFRTSPGNKCCVLIKLSCWLR